VIEAMRRRGVAAPSSVVRFNPARFPSKADLSFSFTASGQVCRRLSVEGETIDLDRVTAVWYRRPQPPVPHAEIIDERVRTCVADECQWVLNDLWHTLDCRWVPARPSVIRRAEHKLAQLTLAGALGFELPPTLLTNSPAAFLEFHRQQNADVVSKVAGRPFTLGFTEQFVRYTEGVTRQDVGYADSIRYAPVIFQSYVPKQVELRVTVVGQKVFAAEIHSQASHHTRHDWRRYDWSKTLYLPHTLPPDVERRCLQLLERLGLCFGAIDMILTPDRRYVFLEINPNGQYLWIEEETGLAISDALCDLLISEAVSHPHA
jgi:hypothetical protein